MTGTGQLPKFADQLYHAGEDDLYLVPTVEVPVTNYLSGDIIDGSDYQFATAYPCFRREAGAAGVGTRGITRMHQFDKVEMVMLSHQRKVSKLTDLCYTLSIFCSNLACITALDLCTGDRFQFCSHD